MTLRHFKIFVTVCDNMNMTAASKNLFISQSAVSQAIAEMENHYGLRLFERLSRKLYLTRAGRELLGYARHIVNTNDQVEKDMKILSDNDLIRVGASVTVASYVLPELVCKFKNCDSNTNINVVEDNTSQIENLILNDKVDIGLVEGDIRSSDMLSFPFVEDELVLICGPMHPFSKFKCVGAKKLEGQDFIVREEGSGTRKTFESGMKSKELNWKNIWVCNNADTIKMAVSKGIGLSVISKLSVMHEVDDGLLCKIDVKDIEFKRQFKIIYHKNKYLTKYMRIFIDLCLKNFHD